MASKTSKASQPGGKTGRVSASHTASAKSTRSTSKLKESKTKTKQDGLSEYGESEYTDTQSIPDENRETLAWKVLSLEQTKELSELETVEDVQGKMVEIMCLPHHLIDLKEATLLDYYTTAIWWAREQSYNHEQQSALFTVINTLLENIKEKHVGIVENIKEFRKMLAGIGVEGPEISGGLECFDSTQGKEIFDYVHNSLFQHYHLFEFVFSHTQAEEIIGTDLEVEIAPFANVPWPPPLEEGVNGEIHRDHIATPPPTPPPAVSKEGEEPKDEAVESATDDSTGIDPQKESDLMAQLSQEEIKNIINSTFDEMLCGLQTDIAAKLRDKENAIIARINKVHKVAEKRTD